MLENGNGASRQAVVYEANHDLREVVGEIIEVTVPETGRHPRSSAQHRLAGPGTLGE